MVRPRRVGAALVVVGLLASPAWALDPATAPAQYLRDGWTSHDGLPSDSVLSLHQSHDGYLWIGTPEGVARFDGTRFVVPDRSRLPMIESSVHAVAEAADGALWIASDRGGGVVRWNRGGDGSARTFTSRGDGLPHAYVRALARDGAGQIWAGTAAGLARWSAGAWLPTPASLPPDLGVRTLATTPTGGLLVGSDAGLFRIDAGRMKAVPAAGLTGSPRALLALSDDALLVGTSAGLFSVRRGRAERWPLPAEAGEVVTALLRDRAGQIWAGTQTALVRHRDGRGELLPTGGTGVRALLEDAEGNLWVGTSRLGLWRLRDDVFARFDRRTLGADRVGGVAFAGDVVWTTARLTTDASALIAVMPDGVRRLGESAGLPRSPVSSLAAGGDGGLWLAADQRLFRAGEAVSPQAGPTGLQQVLLDGRGRLWGTTRDQVLTLPGGASFGEAQGLSQPRLLYEGPRGTIWAASDDALYRLDEAAARAHRVAIFRHDGHRADVASLFEDDGGDLWIATEGAGLIRVRGSEVFRFGVPHGLPSERLAQVLGHGDQLWISCSRGIFLVTKGALDEVARGRAAKVSPRLWGARDGVEMAGLLPTLPSGARAPDGKLWFATGDGLVNVDPRRLRPAPRPAAPVIEEVVIDGVVVSPGQATLQISPGARRLEIRYTAVALGEPEAVLFRHRLEGFDHDWVDAGHARLVAYTALPPGTYRWSLKAGSADGGWNDTVASMTWRVLPPWWRTGWFLAGCAAVLVAGAFASHRLRLARVAARYRTVLEERARIAREIHDGLSQGLVAVSAQIECAQQSLTLAPSQTSQHLERAREAAEATLVEARRSAWALRPHGLDQADLPTALQTLAQRLEGAARIEVTLEGPRRPLRAEVEDHLLRVAQEAITNALRHGGARVIAVELRWTERGVALMVRDDGRGLSAGAGPTPFGGTGLAGMKARLESVGGTILVKDAPGGGTIVSAEVTNA